MLYTKDVTLTDDTLTTVFTVPTGHVAHWSMLFISNHKGSTDDITVYIDKASGTDVYIFEAKNVSSKDYLLLSDAVFVLQPGDKVMAQAGSATANFSVACTIELLNAPNVVTEFNGG